MRAACRTRRPSFRFIPSSRTAPTAMFSLPFLPQRAFSSLTDREVLALAIQNEEEDGRIYREFAERLRTDYPASAEMFDEMAEEENGTASGCSISSRSASATTSRSSAASDVRGFMRRKPVWMIASLRHRRHAAARRIDGGGSREFLSAGGGADIRRRRCASCSATSPTSRTATRRSPAR